MRIKTFIINLAKDSDRKRYMIDLLSRYDILDIEFIDAVDGRKLTSQEIKQVFDEKKFLELYNRKASLPEIGCTASHYKCYKKMLEYNIHHALILEDDIEIPKKDFPVLLPLIVKDISNNQPNIFLLSDWYWYSKVESFYKGYDKAKIFAGYLGHSYVINLRAAEFMTMSRPSLMADDWQRIIKKGINIFAIKPHLIQQSWTDNFRSNIPTNKILNTICESKSLLSVIRNIAYKFSLLPNRIKLYMLRKRGHFYPPHSNKGEWENMNK